MKAFMIVGAESSGNRLMAGLIVSCGVWGYSSTNQPKPEDIPSDRDVVVIAHLEPSIYAYRSMFTANGQEIVYIIMVRDPWVQEHSRTIHAESSYAQSRRRYQNDYRSAFRAILGSDSVFKLIPYEALLRPGAPERILSLFGLKRHHELRVQNEECEIFDANAKWYGG